MDTDDRKRWNRFLLVQSITLIRIPLAIGFGIVLLCFPLTTSTLSLCFGVLLLCELSDVADGSLARWLGVDSSWGAMLDPYADSMARLIVYWSLARVDLGLWYVPLVMALRDVTVAYCRITLAKGGRTVSAKLSGKIKAVVQGAGALLLVMGPLFWDWGIGMWTMPVLSWVVILTTAASGGEYLFGALGVVRQIGLRPDN